MPLPISAPESVRQQAGSLQSTFPFEPSERLGDSVAFKAIDCLNGGIIEVCEPAEKALSDSDGLVTFPTFGFYEGEICSTNANPSVIEELAALASRSLERSTSYFVEQGLWTGQPQSFPIAGNGALASQGADDINSGAAVGVVTAISQMVSALNDLLAGERGVIHVPQWTIPFLDWYDLVERNGNILQVRNTDHVYVAGTGYTGTDPDGGQPAAGESWIYGTGPVKTLISEIFIPGPQVDRSINQIEVRAERAAVSVFNPCAHIAVLVCLPDPGPACGSA